MRSPSRRRGSSMPSPSRVPWRKCRPRSRIGSSRAAACSSSTAPRRCRPPCAAPGAASSCTSRACSRPTSPTCAAPSRWRASASEPPLRPTPPTGSKPMFLRLRPLAFALLLAGVAAPAAATDLVQAYDMARQGDPRLAIAESQVGVADENVVQARSNLLPQVSGSLDLQKDDVFSQGIEQIIDSSGNVSFGPSRGGSDTKRRTSAINVRQSVYDRSNYTRLGASKARAEAAAADSTAAANDLMVRVAEAYFDVLTKIETLVASRAEVDAVKRQLDQAEKRLEVGLAP